MSTRRFSSFQIAAGITESAVLAADPLTKARAALETAAHPEAALPQIAADLAGSALADLCVIYLTDDLGNLRAAARAASVCAACPRLDEALLAGAAAALHSRQAALLAGDDPAGQPLARAALADGLLLRSIILAPLTARGRRLGVLALIGIAPGPAVGGAELEAAANLAFCLALALDQSRLVGEQRMAGEFLRHHAQTLEAIIQSVPSAIALYDSTPDYRCLRHNPAFRALVGPADAGADPADQLAGLPL
ncbi:MAG TPA: GAF domain-containing protein, partial [Herpetosiphonaceae bacterium]